MLSFFALGFIGLVYAIALRRFRFPMQLEWAEGVVLDMTRRVLHHQALYVAPSKDFVSFMYTPIYYYLGAALSHFTGVSLSTLRLLSLLATTGCLVLIFNFVRRTTGSLFSAWMACGLFMALYGQVNGWYDLARVDMLYLFFLLLAIDLSQRGFSVWAAIVFVIAFQTKQTALTVALFVLAHEIRRPRKLIAGLGTFGLGASISFWLINHQSHGWFQYYTVFLPSKQAWMSHKFFTFWVRDLVDPLSVTLALLMVGAGLYLSEMSKDRRQTNFVMFTTVGVTVSAITARLHLGGTTNVTLPLFAWICILFGLSLHTILAQTKRAPATLAPLLGVAVLAACGIQFVHLVYSPRVFLPNPQQKASAAQVVGRVSKLPGKIFVLHHVADAGSSDKEGFAGSMAIWDVLRADHGESGRRLKAELINSFQNHEYDGILSDGPPNAMLPEEEEFLKDVTAAATAAYPKQERVMSPAEAKDFYTSATTPQIMPQFLYVRQ
ncbi:MAG TPA: hypothetical protein VF214_04715 [Edaphobacter sp.]